MAGEKGNPVPVELVLGINDGTFTEVLSGPLIQGQQVILGLNIPSPKAPSRAAKRFGF